MEVIALLRDLAIIVLALTFIVAGVVGLVLLWQVWKLLGFVREKLDQVTFAAMDVLGAARGVLGTAQQTVGTVRGTTEFVSELVVRPVVGITSAVAAASAFTKALFRPERGTRKGGKQQ